MNQHLQDIATLIQQDEKLSAEQKAVISKSLKDADKELEITAFKLDRTEKVKRTTAILLEETIVELEQKRKAVESTNHELEIESSLERVRTVAMGMRNPDDMLQVCRIISEQLKLLNVKEIRNVQTAIIYESKGTYLNYEYYVKHDKLLTTEVDFKNHPIQERFANQMLTGAEEMFTENITGEELQKWLAYQKTTNQFADVFLEEASSLNYYWYSLGPVALGISTYASLSEEEIVLFKRFRNVFELAYKRFLDIQKAQAQAREAMVEAALERVRSRSMAMHKSEEVMEVAVTMYEELKKLEFAYGACTIIIIDKTTGNTEHWVAGFNQKKYSESFFVKNFNHPFYKNQIAAWKAGEKYAVMKLEGKSKISYDDIMFTETDFKNFPEEGKKMMRQLESVTFSIAYLEHGALTWGPEAISEEAGLVLQRFAKVFDQAYTRFLDLQKAEAQTREAQIELALERVRARTMAMQKSEELHETSQILFEQMKELGEPVEQLTIGIIKETENVVEIFATIKGSQLKQSFQHSIDEPTVMNKIYRGWKSEQKSLLVEMNSDEIQIYNRYRNELVKSEMFSTAVSKDDRRIIYVAYFSKGMLALGSNTSLSEESHRLLERFAGVFDGIYTRFLDLQKAEAQAREAQIEAALEKVRSCSLAMHKSDELGEVVTVLLEKMQSLGFVINEGAAAHINIFTEGTKDVVQWTASPHQLEPVCLKVPYTDHVLLTDFFEAKEKGLNFFAKTYSFEEKNEWFNYAFEHSDFKYLPDSLKQALLESENYSHWITIEKNSSIVINSISGNVLSENQIKIQKRFARVFEQAYVRFLDLQKAEVQALRAEQDLIAIKEARQKAEEALIELQATQKQLIQSEKMASLGELTAGIAHEIQNPLNFVNNFSEVSVELVDEMNEEIENGNLEDAKQIAQDLKQNLEKINHHGKRAGDIVKGMLLHSRSSSSVKEPTDINSLCDEYLRLSYHGLRAKDKSFNATMKTDFDTTLENVNIIPQDIGRVVLNLLTNAFYAASLHSKGGFSDSDSGKTPTVWVSTKQVDNKVLISVRDNGPGIPQKILDKIFQPFFTTKPTGQGTGLGLSLSYDIVKAHGGELIVETTEGQGTTFIISLPININ